MLKKIRNYLIKRWEKVTYNQLIIFYLVVGIIFLISFSISILDTTGWHAWKIVPIILLAFWIASMFLYYRFQDEIEKKKKGK